MSAELIAGRYELRQKLGRGGRGEIYLVQDVRLHRASAMKLLRNPGSDEEVYYFHREARSLAALRHPHIVQIYDYSGPDEEPPFIVMELVEGGNLAEGFEGHFPLPDYVIMSVVASVADALAHAHEHGVIHRDLKPANIMLEPSGRVQLTDFGLAKAYQDASILGETVAKRVTRLFGTADFLAPEQVLEERSGTESDVFSLGSVIYWLAAGFSPFGDSDRVASMRNVINRECDPLREIRHDLPHELYDIVLACHRDAPHERASAAEIRDICRQWLKRSRVDVPGDTGRFLQGHVLSGSLEPATEQELEEPTNGARGVPTRARARTERADPVHDSEAGSASEPSVLPDANATTEPDGPARRGSTDDTRIRPAQPPRPRQAPQSRPVARRRLWPILAAVIGVSTMAGAGWLFTANRAARRPESTKKAPTAESLHDPGAAAEPARAPTRPAPRSPEPADPRPEPATAAAEPTPADDDSRATNSPPADDRPRGRNRSRRRKTRPNANDPGPMDATPVNEPAAAPEVAASEEPVVLKIVVEPWGKVFLDGKYIGNTPVIRQLTAPAGPHRVTAVHPVLGTVEKTLRFGEQKTLTLTFPR